MGDPRDPGYYRDTGFYGQPGDRRDRGFGPEPGETRVGCTGGHETVTRFRRLAAPNLRNASIDRLDSCNEVSIGLLAALAITAAISVVALPFFDVAGMGWIRSWEGSWMTMDKFQRQLDVSGLRPKSMDFSFDVHGINYQKLKDDPKTRYTFETILKHRIADEVGHGADAKDVSLKMKEGDAAPSPPPGPAPAANPTPLTEAEAEAAAAQAPQRLLSVVQEEVPGGPVVTVDMTAKVKAEAKMDELEATLVEATPKICGYLQDDLQRADDLKAVAEGDIVVVNTTSPKAVIDNTKSFTHMDYDGNGFVKWNEFRRMSKHLKEPMSRQQALHAFQGLDENGDDALEPDEWEDSIQRPAFFHHTEKTYITRTSTLATTPEPTPVPTPVPTPAPTPQAPSLRPSTSAPTSSIASTTFTTTSATQTTMEPHFVSIRLEMSSLAWQSVSLEDRVSLAHAYQEDLAYAAGLLSEEVMNVEGMEDCVSMGAGAVGVVTVAQGCLPIPHGATVQDLEAVVSSGSMKTKIMNDFGQVVGEGQIDRRHMLIDVTPQHTCKATVGARGTPAGIGTYCMRSTTTGVSTTTLSKAIPSPTEAPTAAPPSTTGPPLMTMAEFLHRMGASPSDSPRDAFATLDTNGNDFADLLEFEDVTGKFHPSLSVLQSKNMFDLLDSNHDGRVESIEFFEAFSQAGTTRPPGARAEDLVPLSQYREALGHSARYRKVGVGLCRTASEAWPSADPHPEALSKAACLGLCDASPSCGAFAFKLGGMCRIYPNSKRYADTTPMTDVECFTRGYGDEANFDTARARFRFRVGDGMSGMTHAQLAAAGVELANSLAYEVGADVMQIQDIEKQAGRCSFSLQPKLRLNRDDDKSSMPEAVCDIVLPSGRRIEDLSAVISADSTKERLAQDLSSQDGVPKLSLDTIEAKVTGTSAKFAAADKDNSGALTLQEFQDAVFKLHPPVDKDNAKAVFEGLDGDTDDLLTAAEFEADGIRKYHTS